MSGLLLDGKRKRVVGSVSVGCTPKQLKKEVQTMIFKFHDFANLTQERDKAILSPSIRAFGHEWNIVLFPRGEGLSSTDDAEYVSCFLRHVGDDTPITARCSFRCKEKWKTFPIVLFNNFSIVGVRNFLTRKDALEEYLDEDGTLIIEIDMQIAVDKENDDDDVWYPKLNIPNDMLTQLYHSSSDDDTNNTADVVFVVDGQEFPAHKNILSIRARTIFELMKDNNNNKEVVPIPNMESDVFEAVLKFVYCVEKPKIEDEATATKFLLAANRLGIVDLKMFVESTIVEKILDTSNAAEMLILSDSHSCPLLKEATMKLYENNNASTIMESEGWSKIEESPRLLVEILRFVCNVKQQTQQQSSSTTTIETNLDVTSLRERLLDANLDIDGSQEMLMERLKDHIISTTPRGPPKFL